MTFRAAFLKFNRHFLPLILLAGTASGAAAQEILQTADPQVVLEVAKGFGSASLEGDKGGDPKISGRMQGVKYVVYFYDCKDGAECGSIQLYAGYTDPFDVQKANEWNIKYRWIKVSADNGSNFTQDIDFHGGITRDSLEAQFGTWDSFISKIKETVGDK